MINELIMFDAMVTMQSWRCIDNGWGETVDDDWSGGARVGDKEYYLISVFEKLRKGDYMSRKWLYAREDGCLKRYMRAETVETRIRIQTTWGSNLLAYGPGCLLEEREASLRAGRLVLKLEFTGFTTCEEFLKVGFCQWEREQGEIEVTSWHKIRNHTPHHLFFHFLSSFVPRLRVYITGIRIRLNLQSSSKQPFHTNKLIFNQSSFSFFIEQDVHFPGNGANFITFVSE